MSDSGRLDHKSEKLIASKVKLHYDTQSNDLNRDTQQSTRQSQKNIETKLKQDSKRRHNNEVIDQKKERQNRYRQQNREKLKQREVERRKRKEKPQVITEATTLNMDRVLPDNMDITDASLSELQETQTSSVPENELPREKFLRKKRERQQKYREQNREILKQREAERRRLKKIAKNADSSTSSNIEYIEVLCDAIIDDEITSDSSNVTDKEEIQNVFVETIRRERAVTSREFKGIVQRKTRSKMSKRNK